MSDKHKDSNSQKNIPYRFGYYFGKVIKIVAFLVLITIIVLLAVHH